MNKIVHSSSKKSSKRNSVNRCYFVKVALIKRLFKQIRFKIFAKIYLKF